MPKYKYKFCDGTESVVKVSDEHYALLKAMDRQEKENNRRNKRQSEPAKVPMKSEVGVK